MTSAARSAPAAARDCEPILLTLRDCLPRPARVLEIASSTGEHAVLFSGAVPELTWQPTDRDPEALRSIAAWRDRTSLPNLLPPLPLDAATDTWPVAQTDAVVVINMIHIAPGAATQGLIAGAARVLTPGGLLYLYGPFREGGLHTGAGNAAFDSDLRARDPSWGTRDLDEIAALAGRHGFTAPELGDDKFDEIVEAGGHGWKHDIDSVGGTRLQPRLHRIGDLAGRANDLEAAEAAHHLGKLPDG